MWLSLCGCWMSARIQRRLAKIYLSILGFRSIIVLCETNLILSLINAQFSGGYLEVKQNPSLAKRRREPGQVLWKLASSVLHIVNLWETTETITNCTQSLRMRKNSLQYWWTFPRRPHWPWQTNILWSLGNDPVILVALSHKFILTAQPASFCVTNTWLGRHWRWWDLFNIIDRQCPLCF